MDRAVLNTLQHPYAEEATKDNSILTLDIIFRTAVTQIDPRMIKNGSDRVMLENFHIDDILHYQQQGMNNYLYIQ